MASLFAREPSWISVAVAQTTLVVWLAALAGGDFGKADPGTHPILVRAASRDGAAVAGLFGFVVPVVFGMFPRLAPGLLGLPRLGRLSTRLPPTVGAVLSACALLWLLTGEAALLPALPLLALAGAFALISAMAGARRLRANGLPTVGPAVQLPARLLLAAALVHLAAGSALLFAVAASPDGFTGLRPTTLSLWPLHLLTAGFVVLTVFGVGVRMFASFSGVEPPAAAVWIMLVCGALAPTGLALSLERFSLTWIALFGTIAAAAAVTFAALVLFMWVRHRRRRRKAWYLIIAAALTLVAGESLAVAFALDPRGWALAPVHGEINTVGFAGLMIFGVLFELSAGRAARPDVLSPGHAIAFAWPAGLAMRALGYFFLAPALAGVGDLLILGALLLAARDAHPRGPRPLEALRPAGGESKDQPAE